MRSVISALRQRREFVAQATLWLTILVAYRLLMSWWFSATKLPEERYFQPVLLWAAITGPRAASFLGALAVCIAGAWPLRWCDLADGSRADRRDPSLSMHWMVVALAVIVAWACGCYEYNFYFDRWHAVDRWLVVACAALTFWRPAFAPLTALMGFLVMHQFEKPLPGFTWTDKRILFDALVLFQAYLLVRRFRFVSPLVYVGLLLTIHGANYFAAAWAKLELNWLAHEELHCLFVSSYLNGWLSMLSTEQVLDAAAAMRSVNACLVGATIATELAALTLLWNRKACTTVLLLSAALHMAIVAVSGVFFWKWILLDATLVAAVASISRESAGRLFCRTHFAIGVLVILASPWTLRPWRLGWYDTRLTEHYRFIGETMDGRSIDLPRLDFAPYDVIFAQNRFHWLRDAPTHVGTYGTCPSLEAAKRVNAIMSPWEVARLPAVSTGALSEHRPDDVPAMKRFLERFEAARRTADERWTIPKWLQPPPHILSSCGQRPDEAVALDRIEVRFLQQFYFDDCLVKVQEVPVMRVEVGSTGRAAVTRD